MNSEIRSLESQIGELKAKLAEARRRAAAEPVNDYQLRRPDGTPVMLSALFGSKTELLVVHNMGRKCPYCTLWADGFNGVWRHLADRAAFVVTSPDEPAVMREFAASRGWGFVMASIAGSPFARDLGYEPEPGKFWPGVSGLRLRGGRIERTGCATFGPGDDFCSVWPMLELIDGGKGEWEPRYSY